MSSTPSTPTTPPSDVAAAWRSASDAVRGLEALVQLARHYLNNVNTRLPELQDPDRLEQRAVELTAAVSEVTEDLLALAQLLRDTGAAAR